ncbi:hypothetical protein BTG99_09230 [Acinetobacter baumannii]|nr:hypothetical protein BTG99_09230 [Acinetobacter baumannii]
MDDWQCKYCNGYIMVNHSRIEVGEKVYFLVYKFDAKNERKKLDLLRKSLLQVHPIYQCSD